MTSDIETVANAVRRHIGEYSAVTACRWALANLNAGFAREGVLRQFRIAHGTRDFCLYAFLKQDFGK